MNGIKQTKTLFFILISLTLFSQSRTKNLSSLSYDKLHDLYFANPKNETLQLECAKAYLAKANNENISIRKAKANYQFALLYYEKDSKKAIQYLDSVIKYSLDTNDKYFPASAYCEKAELLKKQFKFKEAMANYNLAEKVTIKTNTDFYYNVLSFIATTKSEDLGEYDEALTLYKSCFNFYKTKNVRLPQYASYYQDIIFGMADCYKSLKNTDSTTYYNKLGYNESRITQNKKFQYLFVLNEGANQLFKRNYKAAIDSIEKALPIMITNNDQGNVLASYYYLGKTYDGLGNKEMAVKNFIRVDSVYKKAKEISTEFIEGYPYLISYYKTKGDKENQLKYITKYMEIDSVLERNYKEFNTIIQKEYDNPHLFLEKEKLIKSLKNDNQKSYWGITILLLSSVSIGFFGVYQHRQKNKYKTRFEKLINQKQTSNESLHNSVNNEVEIQNISKTEIGINEELIKQILEKLDRFEYKNEYLQPNITIQTLSVSFKTNSKYISKIINTYKNKTFTQYINDLRIEYAVDLLKKNPKLRKYTINALAIDFGYNNAESFSTAFFKKTGIKPSYFIKELEKIEII
ncbi:helix-turn-helix transcriptional regulator [Flavobacterium zhairuonense]|uniref:helix-turn-helix domain-containing protein n=1 Tax=Flavobacterium zhairuonense TaxID=2493631 RepID=UPI00104A1E4E|nr:AraC family transcriptional regulator [Flavobacterium zhairuonense]KAF2506898.1 helix-turn-helix transcriptional regulator [Flavobacterium zhairuonense]